MEDEQAPIPIGVTGRLTALPLTNAVGNHAVLGSLTFFAWLFETVGWR